MLTYILKLKNKDILIIKYESNYLTLKTNEKNEFNKLI